MPYRAARSTAAGSAVSLRIIHFRSRSCGSPFSSAASRAPGSRNAPRRGRPGFFSTAASTAQMTKVLLREVAVEEPVRDRSKSKRGPPPARAGTPSRRRRTFGNRTRTASCSIPMTTSSSPPSPPNLFAEQARRSPRAGAGTSRRSPLPLSTPLTIANAERAMVPPCPGSGVVWESLACTDRGRTATSPSRGRRARTPPVQEISQNRVPDERELIEVGLQEPLELEGGEDGLPFLLGGPHQGDGALHRVEREPVAQDALEEPDRPTAPPAVREGVSKNSPPVPVELPLRDGGGVQVLQGDRVGDLRVSGRRSPRPAFADKRGFFRARSEAREGGTRRDIDTAPLAQVPPLARGGRTRSRGPLPRSSGRCRRAPRA